MLLPLHSVGEKKKNVASGCTVLVCFKRMYFSAVWLLIFSIVHLLLRRFRVALLRPLGSRNPGAECASCLFFLFIL